MKQDNFKEWKSTKKYQGERKNRSGKVTLFFGTQQQEESKTEEEPVEEPKKEEPKKEEPKAEGKEEKPKKEEKEKAPRKERKQKEEPKVDVISAPAVVDDFEDVVVETKKP